MRQVERLLQKEIMLRLEHAPVSAIVVPSPNGIYIPARTPEQRTLAARVVHQLKLDGQLLPGASDLLVLWRDGSGAIELKRPAAKNLLGAQAKGQLSPAQLAFRRRCEALGINFAVCHSWPEVRETLKAWGCLAPDWIDAEQRVGRRAA